MRKFCFGKSLYSTLFSFPFWRKLAACTSSFYGTTGSSNIASIPGLVLRGDVNIAKQLFVHALTDFESALVLFNLKNPNQHEPPEYLYSIISWLREKVGAGN